MQTVSINDAPRQRRKTIKGLRARLKNARIDGYLLDGGDIAFYFRRLSEDRKMILTYEICLSQNAIEAMNGLKEELCRP